MGPARVAVARRRWLAVAAIAATGSICACDGGRIGTATDQRPNVVLISVDSLRADHLGCYGYARPTSPTLDQLAAEGTLFEVVTSSSSWTLPAHAALFTGLPDFVHGVDRGKRKLTAEQRTLAEALQAAGHHTAGIWSGPLLDPRFGFGQGFDDYWSHAGVDGGKHPGGLEDWQRSVEQSHRDVTGPRVLAKVNAFLASNTAPFFLFVHLWDVHYDYVPPPPYDSMFDPDYDGDVDGRDLVEYVKFGIEGLSPRDREHLIALYDGEIASTDAQIGEILRQLASRGLADRTVVVVTADHGEELFDHGELGHKKTLYDESIRIPLIVRYPARVRSGQRVDRPVRIVDVAPTIIELAGGEPLPDVLGRSLVPLLEGEPLPQSEPAVSELVKMGEPLLAVRTPDWKILAQPTTDTVLGLWDLRDDPHEQTDVYRRDRELTRTATTALRTTLAGLEKLRERHASTSERDEPLPADLESQLRSLGYLADAPGGDPRGALRAKPNPIRVCDGRWGVTTLSWNAPTVVGPVVIRIGSPNGRVFTRSAEIVGSATTDKWVHDGTKFFLVDRDSGKVIGQTIVQVTTAGCEGG